MGFNSGFKGLNFNARVTDEVQRFHDTEEKKEP